MNEGKETVAALLNMILLYSFTDRYSSGWPCCQDMVLDEN